MSSLTFGPDVCFHTNFVIIPSLLVLLVPSTKNQFVASSTIASSPAFAMGGEFVFAVVLLLSLLSLLLMSFAGAVESVAAVILSYWFVEAVVFPSAAVVVSLCLDDKEVEVAAETESTVIVALVSETV